LSPSCVVYELPPSKLRSGQIWRDRDKDNDTLKIIIKIKIKISQHCKEDDTRIDSLEEAEKRSKQTDILYTNMDTDTSIKTLKKQITSLNATLVRYKYGMSMSKIRMYSTLC